jgi:hypothetical protein
VTDILEPIIELIALALMTVITVGVPILVRIASQKWKVEIDETQQRMLEDAARRAVMLAEEEARRQLGASGRLSGEEKHEIASVRVKETCGAKCTDEDIDAAVSVAVNEMRAETIPPKGSQS